MKINSNFGVNDRYTIKSILGTGGMGIVYLAFDNILQEKVAIKTLNKELASNESVKNRFLNEAKICLTLTHPNIIRVRDVSFWDDVYFMVMEYIDGVELKYIMKNIDINNTIYICNIIKPIMNALDFAHKFTIHRDIKPSNIMIKDDIPYLMDFGISTALEDSVLINNTIVGGMGTKKYVSPEQTFNANDVDKRTDIYSMGILLYELFTKVVPKNTSIEDPEDLYKYNKNIPLDINNIILKMIEPKPIMRPNSFEEILNVFNNVDFSNIISNKKLQISDNSRNEIENICNDYILIEKGKFLRGSGIESKIPIEKPRKPIYLDDYYINKYCVTNEEYNIFLENTKYKIPKHFEENLKIKPNNPVVNVSFDDCLAYCDYKNCSLPSEAQWEKAAKGSKNNIYPWGNNFDNSRLNIGYINNDTVEVNKYKNGISEDGLYNMAGNIWEWCLDDFDENYYKSEEDENPICINDSNLKILRGGSFDFVNTASRTSFRFNTKRENFENNIGFRTVINIKVK